jgi:hypothetical protein
VFSSKNGLKRKGFSDIINLRKCDEAISRYGSLV